MKGLARFGCLARALVYFLIGVLALLVAFGHPAGETTDTRGALRFVLDRPFGNFALIVIGLGLIAYAVWRLVQGWQDRDNYGRDLVGITTRVTLMISGIAHFFLAIYAFNLVFGFARTARLGERAMAKWFLNQPLGNYGLELVGAIVIITGTVQFFRAFSGAFLRDLDVPARLIPICRFGLVARGVVFVIIGSFFFQSGWKARSREAGGLHKAWETLHQQPFGQYLLGIVAAGFIAFAVFGWIEGFYRKTI